jgi:hypothetical protein
MFSRTDHDVPEDFDFPTTLDELGLKRDLRGRYVLIADEDKFYNYRRYDTKSTNDKYSEAVHKAIRNDVYAWLDTMGIKLIYTHDKDLSTTSKIPGEKPKIKMLCGGFDADLKDVYVFIGDSRRELGIVSRVATDSEGGPREGTVLGVAKALQSRGSWSGLPAMLVLNPGELLYSYATKSCMTQDIWNTRKRPHAFAEQYAVTDKNKVPGHATPQEHVNTVLDHILPQLVEEQHERLHIIAVGDGGENVLKYLNEKFTDDPNAKIAGLTLVSVALVNSSHDTDTLNSAHLKKFMAKHGRAWDSSAEPKNTVLGKVAPEFAHYTQNNDNDNPSSDNEASGMSMVFPKRHVPHVGRKRAVSALSEGLKEQRRTGGPHNDITHIEADVFNDVFYSDSVGSPGSTTSSEAGIALPPLISDKYPSMSVPGLTMKQYRKECDSGPEGRRRSSASIEDTTLANPDQYRISGPSKPIPIPGREEAFKKFHAEEKRKKQEAKKEAKEKAAFEELKALGHKVDADMKKKKAEQAKKAAEAKKIIEEEIAAAERAMNEMAAAAAGQQEQPTFAPSPGHDITTQYATVPTRAEEAATTTENENEAHDYYAKPFICTTVSAGLEDVTEQIFPAVREDVLKFVFEQEDMKETKRRVKEMLVRDLRRSVSSLGL